MSLPALSRGLSLLEELIRNPDGLRNRDLKKILSDVGDASLNRLLTSLIESGHVTKREGLYYPSNRVTNWIDLLDRRKGFEESLSRLINSVTEQSGESAGFCLYMGDRIKVLHSHSYPDSINIIGAGNTLFYEWDHGASMAILDQLTDGEKKAAFKSEFSRITSENEWLKGKELFAKKNYYADQSQIRPGISRLAVPWTDGEKRGALFLCLPTPVMQKREGELYAILADSLTRFFS